MRYRREFITCDVCGVEEELKESGCMVGLDHFSDGDNLLPIISKRGGGHIKAQHCNVCNDCRSKIVLFNMVEGKLQLRNLKDILLDLSSLDESVI